MGTITDFEGWLDQAEPEGYEELYVLYRCITEEENFGVYECGKQDGRLFIKGDQHGDTLMLASEKAKDTFLELIRRRYVGDEDMSIEAWYMYCRGMGKDD